ncbi:GntR family transcriptional regulator [Mumia sp. zg.B53]|uniref:GntR family transcriptional regulator n=1 Tax=unclassified Mumia TaxID=2621872 RepID=UPI001C6E2BDE|nr:MULTISPECIES: GntR family transcriptional regulator [unclassified Mumia]MBW9211431.1 GntR family transcriptional regulator [Mumia sp. zg.B21]MBW9216604.1 GntR family transcriptional regulator [Mumia sp. zg.B53]
MGARPEISLDRSSPVPLYFQMAEQLEGAIVSGTLAPGDKLDNELVLADRLGLSRPTVRQAIQVLVDKGMLVRKRGVGTQVVHGRVSRSVELTSLHDDLTAAGQAPRTEVLSLARLEASEESARALQLEPGSPVWSLERVRYIGDEPLALMQNLLPASLLDLAAVDLADNGLYAALRRAGIWMRVAKQRIGARRADARESRLLGERRGAPLLTMQRTAYDDAGRAVEYGEHAYRPDLYAFELTLVDR